ncbi:E3 ubiquitin-protein ligase DTX3L [Hondaea fermentalgiana]|uniref:RING-type E3 ubiquitin transferase n=1 Tax=Hondaea fermentalgiana TaxID=2315210 RepID=A0A2R5GDW8_9STRA|nr:E3 ubiquitin-protein ligase DTX3L [Hondaea fermentalgiana]|eukprot:GBG27918.1 E3 ubiquitin-protein ligase DTX3L [Hondaea fermentalgiana]
MRWEFDNGVLGGPPRWTPCAPELEAHLNALVAAGSTSTQVMMGPFAYLLELVPTMRQRNLHTGRARDLRPAGVATAAVPANAGSQAGFAPTGHHHHQLAGFPSAGAPAPAPPRTRREKRKASRGDPLDEQIVHSGQETASGIKHEHVWEQMEFIKAADLDPKEHCHICLLEFVDDDNDTDPSTGAPKDGSSSATEANSAASSASSAAANSNQDADMEPLDCVKLPNCHGHYFHTDCIKRWFAEKPKCPSCGHFYGQEIGTQPAGTMVSHKSKSSLPGHGGCGTIEISYHFSSGIQGPEHPNPGERFYGTSRCAYLPDNEQGRKCHLLLQQAFRNRVCFTVGTSLTTNRGNSVIWNGIHHKTSRCGGPTSFGYPDPTYLNRLELELASKGVTASVLPKGTGAKASARSSSRKSK